VKRTAVPFLGFDCGGHQKSAWKLFEDALPAKKDVYDNSYIV